MSNSKNSIVPIQILREELNDNDRKVNEFNIRIAIDKIEE